MTGGRSVAERAPSLFLRAALAVVLSVLFYALALTAIGFLGWGAVTLFSRGNSTGIKGGIALAFAALVLLWSILPRFERFQAPGPRLKRERHPRLFAALDETARAVGQKMPDEVYLVGDVNAWVAQRPRPFGLAGPRMMGLGLPLLRVVSEGEMRAVLAHEFGHFHGGETRLGPWIYRTRSAIFRTVGNLSRAGNVDGCLAVFLTMLRYPFVVYAKGFLLLTNAVSRRQELAADALAARVAGARALASGLVRIHGAANAYEFYVNKEVLPVLERGARPPIAEGFARFLAAPDVKEALARDLEDESKRPRTDPYDTHPPLARRLAELGAGTDFTPQGEGTPAIALLTDLPAVELEFLAYAFGRSRVAPLTPVTWEEVPARIMVPSWREEVAGKAGLFTGWTAGTVPEHVKDLGRVGRAFVGGDAPPADARAAGAQIVSIALALALIEQGWRAEAGPGTPVTLAKDGEFFPVFALVSALARENAPTDEWRATCARLGISDVRLDSAIRAKA